MIYVVVVVVVVWHSRRRYFDDLHISNKNMIHETMFHKKLRIGVMGMDGGVIKSWGCYVGYFEDKKDERKCRVFSMDGDDEDDDEEGEEDEKHVDQEKERKKFGSEEYSFGKKR